MIINKKLSLEFISFFNEYYELMINGCSCFVVFL